MITSNDANSVDPMPDDDAEKFEGLVGEELARLRIRNEARRRFEEEQRSPEDGNTWKPMDLGPYLRGEIECPKPTLGMRRNDGLQFLYPAREHAVIGETESGKTWFALGCVVAEILNGNRVLYVHFEEPDPASTIERLRLLGLNDQQIDQRMCFIGPSEPVTPERLAPLLEPTPDPPALVILDGVNDAMALLGLEVKDLDGAAEFRRRLIRPCVQAGAAVLSCDHFPLDADSSRRDAFGSVHKGAALDGSRLVLENFEPFGTGMREASNLYITKDRPGHLRKHGKPTKTPGKTLMGTLVVDDSVSPFEPFSMMLYAPKDVEDSVSPSESQLADEVWEVIYTQPDHAVGSQRDLFAQMRSAGMKFRKQAATDCLDDLLLCERLVEVRGLKGQGRSVGYRAISSASQDSGGEV